MTIALGILAKDGLVLASDSQETIPGYWKNDVSKMSYMTQSSPSAWRACIVMGAGHAHYVDAFRTGLFLQFEEAKTHEDVSAGFSAHLSDFYQTKVIPFAAYQPHERPDFQILVGYRFPGQSECRLRVSELSAWSEEHPYAAIGVGSMLAKTLLTRCYRDWPMPNVREATVLCAYVMSQVKRSVDGCGAATDVGGFHDEHMFNVTREQAASLEEAVSVYAEAAEQFTLLRTTKRKPPREPKAVKAALSSVQRALAAIQF
jgi:hypothetical protein